jgi:branched-chain amino acid transport system substrate-binding protein
VNLRSEIRNPKSERSPKPEARAPRKSCVADRISGFGVLSDSGFRASVFRLILSLVLLSDARAAEPFLRLREATLGYHGPDDELTNLTEIRIGWFGPTNLNDPLTGDLWWAANFAIHEANEQGGCLWNSELRSLPFRLIPRWAVDPWGTGVSQLTRMVYDEQPLALLGSVDSATTHLAEQVVAKANLPLVSPIATDKSITLAGVSWMFSCAPSDAAIARVLVDDVLARLKDGASSPARSSRREEALTSLGGDGKGNRSLLTSAATSKKTRLALLACTDHESRMTTREVLKELSWRGRQPDFRFDVPTGGAVIAQQMSALEASRPAAVVIIAGAEDAARLVQAVKARVPAAALFGSQSFGRRRFLQLAGQTAEGVRFPLLFAPTAADTNAARFTGRFTAEHHRQPDYTAALTYDATRLLLEAIRRAGPNRARIREALMHLSPWSGIAGPIHFDGTGQNTRSNVCLGTIEAGAVVPLASQETISQTAQHTVKP